MQWLAELCVRRSVLAAVLSLVIAVVGGVFYAQLGVDQFPKVDFPFVTVTTVLPGASPVDVEREISDKLEGAINTIAGVDELRSNSSEGISMVMVQFVLEKNVDVAAQEVQQKINTVLGELPKGIDPPIVQKVDPDASPVLYVALNAVGRSPREITDLADRVVRRRLEAVSGVGQVTVIGGRRRQIDVLLDPLRLRALGISPTEVAAAIGAQNVTLPAGRLDLSRDYLTLQVAGRVETVAALGDVVVREQAGRAVRLSELATVEDGLEEPRSAARWNGEPTVVLAVRRQSGTNSIEVVDAVRERIARVQAELPPGFSLDVQRDGSASVRTGTNAVKEHLVLGALFAAVVVLLFLGNLRSTVIAALAIPTSIVGTFALMKLQGYTLNTITLLALALAVGIVIDDAIVVLENIFRFVEEKGMHPVRAAIEGTKEIGPAVLATTLSLIAVFLPIAFIGGMAGRFLGSFGVTMSFAIAVSLFVSFTLTPMLASRWLHPVVPGGPRPLLERVVDVFYRPLERGYVALLRFCMAHRWLVVLASAASIGACFPMAAKARKGFLPIDDRAQFEVTVRLPEGKSVASTEVEGERVARAIRAFPEVEATLLTVGEDAARTPNLARIFVKLTPPEQRRLTQSQLKDLVRARVQAGLSRELHVNVGDVADFGGGSTARLQYLVAGPELEVLEAATPRILERMRRIPDIVDLDTSLVVGKPELEVEIDRQRAADLGVQVADVALALQYQVAGVKVSTYEEGGEQYEVRLRAADAYRTSEDALRLLVVASRKLGLVSLADVVRTKRSSSATTIARFQRERQVTFMANGSAGADESKISEAMLAAIRAENLPSQFTAKVQGQSKMMQDTAKSFAFGLLASLVFMYLVLAAQFDSWVHPLTILVTLPLTLSFAVASVLLFDQAIDMFAFLGIFVLFGVVKKNAILQVDHTNVLRARGLGRTEAILQANRDRLRPILMTTLAFVAGMLPLVFSKGIGAGLNRATSGVVVGGQSLSLLLTLVAVPVVYSFFDDVAQWLERRFGLGRGRGRGAHGGPPSSDGPASSATEAPAGGAAPSAAQEVHP